MTTGLSAVVILWIVPIAVAYSMGKNKDRAGFAYGFFLGWLGVLILALLPGAGTSCPFCAERVKYEATVCPHCRREIVEA